MSFGGPVFGQPGGGGFPQPGNPGIFGAFGTPGAPGVSVGPGVFGGPGGPGIPGGFPTPVSPPPFGGGPQPGGFGVGPQEPQRIGYFGPNGGGITTLPIFPQGNGFPDHGPAIANIHQVLADHHNALQSLLAAIHSMANPPAKPSRPSHPLPLQ